MTFVIVEDCKALKCLQISQEVKKLRQWLCSLQQFAEKTAWFCDNVPGHLAKYEKKSLFNLLSTRKSVFWVPNPSLICMYI